MTTIDRDRLRRYLSHAAMLLPPDERVVTVAEGAAMLDALSAAERRATRAEAQAETRRQQTAYWQERAEGFEARIERAKSRWRKTNAECVAALNRAEQAEARITAVRDVLAHHPYGGPDQEDAVRRALDAP